MKRELLEQYLGKKVKLTLFDKSCHSGILREEVCEWLPVKKGLFHLRESHVTFRCSHVTKIEELRNND